MLRFVRFELNGHRSPVSSTKSIICLSRVDKSLLYANEASENPKSSINLRSNLGTFRCMSLSTACRASNFSVCRMGVESIVSSERFHFEVSLVIFVNIALPWVS